MAQFRKLQLTNTILLLGFFSLFLIANNATAEDVALSTTTQIMSPVASEKQMLEQTINILEKTNTAISQQWTPINIMLSITAGLFALITILWAGVFTYGFIFFRKIASDKKKMAVEMKNLKIESKEVINRMNAEGEKLINELKQKTKTLPELEKKIKDFTEKSEKAIERLEDKAIGTMTGLNYSDYIGGITPKSAFNINHLGTRFGIGDYKTCSKCGVVFKEDNTYATLSSQLLTLSVWETLCKKCKEEIEKS